MNSFSSIPIGLTNTVLNSCQRCYFQIATISVMLIARKFLFSSANLPKTCSSKLQGIPRLLKELYIRASVTSSYSEIFIQQAEILLQICQRMKSHLTLNYLKKTLFAICHLSQCYGHAISIVRTPPPHFLLVGREGVEPPTKFSKRGT